MSELYRHYKGKLYRVIDHNVIDAGDRPDDYGSTVGIQCVLYRADGEETPLYTRPHSEFHGYKADGTKRFVKVEE